MNPRDHLGCYVSHFMMTGPYDACVGTQTSGSNVQYFFLFQHITYFT